MQGYVTRLAEREADRVADRVMAINDGRLLAIGSPEEVRNDPAVQQAYLGTAA